MKLNNNLQNSLNKQISMELEAAYKYLGIEQYFRERSLLGFAKFFGDHAVEEREHAEDFRTFVEDVDGHVEFNSIEEQPTVYNSALDAFKAALDHEKEISASIRGILKIAIDENNYAAENFLRTYVDEQVEEEDLFRGVLDLVEFAGEDKAALLDVENRIKDLG
ncbi:MAG TPA: ferritin [Tissierellaceae bacterium]|nr:ferritin [Tissierellaceae bacterium]